VIPPEHIITHISPDEIREYRERTKKWRSKMKLTEKKYRYKRKGTKPRGGKKRETVFSAKNSLIALDRIS
jgi:hypothetical protein